MKKFILILALGVLSSFFSTDLARANFEVCQPTDFTADEYVLFEGEGTVLHWDSVGCYDASIVPADYPGDRPPYGSVSTGAIHRTTVYTLTVYDEEGNIGGQRFLTIQIADKNTDNTDSGSDCKIDSFTADDYSLRDGDSTWLRWETTGCDRAKITPDIGSVSLNGDEFVRPAKDITYTLFAYDQDGTSVTKKVSISVENTTCSIDEFSAEDTSIQRGESTTLRWRTTGADEVDITPGYGNRSDDGSVVVRPNDTTVYRLEARCASATKSRSLTVRVADAKTAPQAITTVATVFSTSSAQLNGIAVPNTTTGGTSAWFEWGATQALGSRTASQQISSNNNSTYYNSVVSGLRAGGVYYYRAVVQNQNGTAYGDTVRFQTQTVSIITTPPPTIVRTQTTRSIVVAQSAPSLLELKIESRFDRMCVGGEIDYTITYTNISSQTLQNAILQVSHQKEVTFMNASRGNYDAVDRTLTAQLGSLPAGESGTVVVHGRINDTAVRGNLTVMTATVVYTNTVTRAQENAIAYSLVAVSLDCPNVLGASAFALGAFLPHTLLGWLLLILVILALVVLARQLYRKKEIPPTTL